MDKMFEVNLEAKDGVRLDELFNQLKLMKDFNRLLDDSTSITFNRCKLTAGFYDNYSEFEELYIAVMSGDKEKIINHVKDTLSKYQDNEAVFSAITNITSSLKLHGIEFTDEEKEELDKVWKNKRFSK